MVFSKIGFFSVLSLEIYFKILSYLSPTNLDSFALVSKGIYQFSKFARLENLENLSQKRQLEELCRMCVWASKGRGAYTESLKKYIIREGSTLECNAIAMTILAIFYYQNPELDNGSVDVVRELEVIYKELSHSEPILLMCLIYLLSKGCGIDISFECSNYLLKAYKNPSLNIPVILNPYCAELINKEFVQEAINRIFSQDCMGNKIAENLRDANEIEFWSSFAIKVSLRKLGQLCEPEQLSKICHDIVDKYAENFQRWSNISVGKDKALLGVDSYNDAQKVSEIFSALRSKACNIIWTKLVDLLIECHSNLDSQYYITFFLIKIVDKLDPNNLNILSELEFFLGKLENKDLCVRENFSSLLIKLLGYSSSEEICEFYDKNKLEFRRLCFDEQTFDDEEYSYPNIYCVIAEIFPFLDQSHQSDIIDIVKELMLSNDDQVKENVFSMLSSLCQVATSEQVTDLLPLICQFYLSNIRYLPFTDDSIKLFMNFPTLNGQLAFDVSWLLKQFILQSDNQVVKDEASQMILNIPSDAADQEAIVVAENNLRSRSNMRNIINSSAKNETKITSNKGFPLLDQMEMILALLKKQKFNDRELEHEEPVMHISKKLKI